MTFEDCASFEVYRPADHAYIWSRKDYCREARGAIRYGETQRAVAGVMFVDVNAGYHERHKHWRWAAGAGLDQDGRLVAFNAITGLHDGPANSERTIWIDGEEQEIGPVTFSDDLSTVSFAAGGTKAARCASGRRRLSSSTPTSCSSAPTTSTGSEPTRERCQAASS